MTGRETDTRVRKHRVWKRREKLGLARERVAPQLEPPISAKTLERWEKGVTPLPGWRAAQLESLYDRYEKAAA